MFNNLKDGSKLVAIALILLVGFGAISATYYTLVQVNSDAQAESQRLDQLVLRFQAVRSQLIQAQTSINTFFRNGRLEDFETYKQTVNEAEEIISALNEAAVDEGEKELVQLLSQAQGQFNELVNAAVEVHIELGLDENSGAHGEMRDTVREAERSLIDLMESTAQQAGGNSLETQLTLQKLRASMLQMRRHEKDFIQRETDVYIERMASERETFLATTATLNAGDTGATLAAAIDDYFGKFLTLVELVKQRAATDARTATEFAALSGVVDALVANLNDKFQENLSAAQAQSAFLNKVFIGVLLTVALVTILTVFLLGRGLFRTLASLSSTLQQRASDLERQSKENDQLNESVINLMDAADRLSKRDLTVIVPVSEDITGNVSDALNLMARETARLMTEITAVTGELEQAATTVRRQSDKVSDVAASEREVVASALAALEKSALTMSEMTQLVSDCNALAENTSVSTKRALVAVRNTVQSMGEIRGTVGETEKSIKRLGERSQEISAIVEIIKDIAERTHTLALNAGMQAVAAGEAGRGFSVVADEVQRLAETARESTNQITTLVKSIQAESSESMATMNKTIGQVVKGSELAERAGKRMRMTQKATADLVALVAQIADRSQVQEKINVELREQTTALQVSTDATEQALQAQAKQTSNMFKLLQNLVKSVRVFKLPEAA